MSNLVMRELPRVRQKSIEELIGRNLKYGADGLWRKFRNSVVLKALEVTDGNASKAARILKVHRNTFGVWMKEAGL